MTGHGKTLLLRADASTRMGTGHVMRGLALAQAWQAADGTCRFVAAGLPAALEKRVGEAGFPLQFLEATPGSDEDATGTARMARNHGAQWVVLDGYHFSGPYQRTLKEAGLRVLTLDDHGHASHYPADVVLNQNLHARETSYENRARYTRLLLGPRFALLRREFWPWRGRPRSIPESPGKILVSLGGSDPDNVTSTLVRVFTQCPEKAWEVVLVVGPANPYVEEVERAAREHAGIRILRTVQDMPALMAWADLALIAGGTTCWEVLFMGLPCLVTVLADNQGEIAASLAQAEVAYPLGWGKELATQRGREALLRLAASPTLRKTMSERGRALVDGEGGKRVVQHLLRAG